MMITFKKNVCEDICVNTEQVIKIIRLRNKSAQHSSLEYIVRIFFVNGEMEEFEGVLGNIVWDYFLYRYGKAATQNTVSNGKEIAKHFKNGGF